MRVERGVRRSAVVLAALLAAIAPAGPAVAAAATTTRSLPAEDATPPEPVSEAARAEALAEPAIVQIEVHWEGYVRERGTGEVLDPDPVSASTHCTGAGVGNEGYLLTTRACLDATTVAREAFQQLVDRRVADGRVAAEAADALLGNLLLTATIGMDPTGEAPPERTVTVRRAVTDDEPMRASVVALGDPADGGAALLKIGRSNQPVLPLASDGDLSVGTELVTVQCPPATGSARVGPTPSASASAGDDHLRPTFSTGTVAKTSPRVLVEPAEPGTDLSGSGGVVLTHNAAIAGLVDTSLATGDLLADLSAIRELLTEAKIETGLGQVDQDYRAGLDAFYAGRYGDAIVRFDAVLAIIPSHIQAHQYRDAAQSLRDDEAGVPPTDEVVDQVESWLDRVESWLGGRSWGLVGVIVLVAIVVFFLHRRRPPTEPQAPDGERADEAPATEPDHAPTSKASAAKISGATTSAPETPAADPR
jgi:serine protease Do